MQPYQQAVEELKVKFKSLRNQYRELGEYSPIEFTTGRVKKISSIIEKARRLDIPLSEIEEKMEDIAGLRVICQFIDDIYTVADIIKSRDGKEFDVLYEKDYIAEPKESGYRSYHIILKYPVYSATGAKNILVEIQIRTLAMNFWATIEHSLNYKYRERIPEEVLLRLRSTSVAATKLDKEMTEISKEVKRAQIEFAEKSNYVHGIGMMIQLLYEEGDKEAADAFSLRFDGLNRVEGTPELAYLYWEITRYISERADDRSDEAGSGNAPGSDNKLGSGDGADN